MSWNRWLLAPQRVVRPIRRPRRDRRLTLEALEDRTLFAVSVLSTAVPVPTTGATTANNQSELSPMHAVSDDGRYTVYTSAASNLVANQAASATGTTLNIYLYDNKNGTTTLLSHEAGSSSTTLATTANGDSFNAVISGDGSTVAFYSTATNLAAQNPAGNSVSVSSGTVQLYAYNVSSGKLILVSHQFGNDTVGANGANPAIPPSPSTHWLNTLAYSAGSAALGQDINGLALPSLSKNGQYIAYIDDATNLGGTNTGTYNDGLGDTFQLTNVFLYDNNSSDSAYGNNTLISHAAGNATTTANGPNGAWATTAAISADGSTVAFTDPGTNLVSGQSTDGVSDQLYVWSRIDNSTTGLSAGQTVLASHKAGDNSTGAHIPSTLSSFFGYSQDSPPTLSADGNQIAYYYAGDNLVSSQGGTASVLNVFLYNVKGNSNALVTHVAGTSTTNLATAGNNPQNKVASPGTGPFEATGPQISADGKYIAYANNSNNLVAPNTAAPWSTWNGADNVYLYDNNPSDSAYQTNTLVSNDGTSVTTPDIGGGTAPSISSDGRYVAFMDLAYPTTKVNGSITGATNASPVVITTSSTAGLTTGDLVYITNVGGNTAANNTSTNPAWTITVVDGTHFSLNSSTGNGTYTSGGTWTQVTGKVNVRLFDRQASSSTQPTVIGQSYDLTFLPPLTGSGSNLPASLLLYASALAPTVISADGSTVAWDGPVDAHSMVSTVTDNNTNLDVFLIKAVAPPKITSAGSTTFTVGTSGTTFTVTATGTPAPTLSETGKLPDGITFNAGTLSGTPKPGTGNTYTITFTATNSAGSDSQTFLLTVNEAPSVTSTSTTFTTQGSSSFTLTTKGYPPPTTFTITQGTPPAGVTFNQTTGTFSGTPKPGTGGTSTVTVTATNGVGTGAPQTFTFIVNEPPSITSTTTKFPEGNSSSFTLKTTGYPAPTFTITQGTPPDGVTFNPATGTFSGTPKPGAAGTTGKTYTFTITASNVVGTSVAQTFTLVVLPVPSFTPGPDQTVTESAQASPPTQVVTNWAADILAGSSPAFVVTNNNTALFATQPTVSLNGTLTYQPAQYAHGTANVSVSLTDSGGQRTFGPLVFHITVTPVNQAPSFTPGPNQTVFSGVETSHTVLGWATDVSPGPNQSSETVQFLVSNVTNPGLFTAQPAVSPDGTLTFTTAADAEGTASVTVYLQNSGGTANGGQNTSAPITFTITVVPPTPTTTDTAEVAQAFSDVLGRPLRPSEMTYWNGQFANGVTPLEAAQQIFQSAEYHTKFADAVYQSYLGRPADVVGQGYVMQLFQQGVPSQQIKALILASPEYFQKNGGTNDGFLAALYRDVLGVPLDDAGRATYGAMLAAGASRYDVALAILKSPAAADRLVQQAYLKLLHRAADPAGLQYWSSLLQQGMTEEAFYSNILASPEFDVGAFVRSYNPAPDELWLNQVFQDTLGRSLQPGEDTFFINQLRVGVQRSDVVLEILSSPEYRSLQVTAAFTAALHRAPDPGSVSYYVNFYAQGDTTEQIEGMIYGSPEYLKTQGGGSNEGFLEALYSDVLGRPLDQMGRDFWGPQLASGATDETVADGVLNSDEAHRRLIVAGYQKFMRRPTSTDEVNYWSDRFLHGLTDEQFYARLMASPEYYLRFTASTT